MTYYCVFTKRYDGKFLPVISTISISTSGAVRKYGASSRYYQEKSDAGMAEVRPIRIKEVI